MLDISALAFIGGIGPTEMLVIGVVAVLLFGSRLPSVARSLGKSLTEFKKGMRDIEDDVKTSIYSEPTDRVEYHDRNEPSAPRFEPPETVTAGDESAAETTSAER